ncbi:Coatomer subunit beta [Aphelenchoides fujianensis]|nr:Coatomer subunit beta [Aphelenchoides fujianensis]
MTSSSETCYTLIHTPNEFDVPKEDTLKEKLEKGDVKVKAEALKKLIHMMLNGERLPPGMLMCVIRFCLPTADHFLKKLLLIFWEIVPKTNADGKLLHEMILVCDAYRKDLQHPNEFIRGSTLRFLCKLKEPELLEPLMPSIRKCLDHRHSYVRRNAVLAIFTIYRNFEFLISDAPELISQFLESEQDASCKRNAFMMLLHVDQTRALDYLSSCIDQVNSFGDILQLIIVECATRIPTERGRFIRCVYNLLQSQSAAVRYEAAATLVTLSSARSAIKAAASAYIDLIVKEADNNVKLIVLDRLIELRESIPNEKVLQELLMDILRVLSATDLEVRKKILHLALDLVSGRNVHEMVIRRSTRRTTRLKEDTDLYKQLLVRTLHSATIKFPDVAQQIFPVLMEFLSDENELAASDVLVFVREAIQRLPHLRPVIIQQLLPKATLITADGTYATQSALVSTVSAAAAEKPILRKLFYEGNFFIASFAGHHAEQAGPAPANVNKLAGEAMYILASIIRLGKSTASSKKITEDDLDRISTTIRLIADQWPEADDILLRQCRASLELMLSVKGDVDRHEETTTKRNKVVQADKTISFSQLSARAGETAATTNLFDLSLSQALGTAPKVTKFDFASSKLGKIAYVNVNQYDIVLDVLVVNQTADTLQNLSLEFSTVGDLKLVDKPSPLTLAPHDFSNIKATVKVTSTENGVIFSTIAYDVRGSTSDRNCVYLQDIHIDIMDYIVPGSCTDTEFRKMWQRI